jgi:hypothetical protein
LDSQWSACFGIGSLNSMNYLHTKSSRLILLSLFIIVAIGFYLRTFMLWRDFVFVYDQGRDALKVQEILKGHLTLIGPTTGLSGVFLGPFFFYFLLPWYVIGQGNPIVPAFFFAFMQSCVAALLFFYANRVAGKKAGYLAAFIYTISFSNIMFARWLSNPVPLPFFSLLLFLTVMYALEHKKVIWFLVTGVLMGICLQLEAANAVFLLPVLALVVLGELYKKAKRRTRVMNAKQSAALFFTVLWEKRQLWGAVIVGFLVTLVPQLLFELKHNFLSLRSLVTAFQTTHESSVSSNIPKRFELLLDLYARGIFPEAEKVFIPFIVGVIAIGVQLRTKLWKLLSFRIAFWWFVIPFVCDILYNGNHGNFWDYYIIAQHGVLYILIASILCVGVTQKKLLRFISVGLLLLLIPLSLVTNMKRWTGFFPVYKERIALSLQVEAIDWITSDTNGQPFGSWAYTPAAQDDPYRYLFAYRARKSGVVPVEHPEHTKNMYLIVEDDNGHAKRRETWIKDMSAIGKIVDSRTFGAVTVFKVERK